MKVLVAEDDAVCAHLAMKLVRQFGHEPKLARDGQEALDIMTADPHPVVLSDWMMPVMDGISLCKAIREMKSSSHVYFILVTSKIPTEKECHALAHVDAFLPKPLSRDVLLAKLNVAQSIIPNSTIRPVA